MNEPLYKAKRLDTGEWAEGDYWNLGFILCAPGSWKHDASNRFHGTINYLKNPKDYSHCEDLVHRVDTKTVCQYIGVNDDLTNKIFYGAIIRLCDVTEYDDWKESPDEFGEPVYTHHVVENGGQEYPAFYLNPDVGEEMNCFSYILTYGELRMEVVGNKFDNPELLEKVK